MLKAGNPVLTEAQLDAGRRHWEAVGRAMVEECEEARLERLRARLHEVEIKAAWQAGYEAGKRAAEQG